MPYAEGSRNYRRAQRGQRLIEEQEHPRPLLRDFDATKEQIEDAIVGLLLLADHLGMDPNDCLQVAYEWCLEEGANDRESE